MPRSLKLGAKYFAALARRCKIPQQNAQPMAGEGLIDWLVGRNMRVSNMSHLSES